MRIWLQVAARAAMGDDHYRGVGEQIGRGFLLWGKGQLKSDNDAQRDIGFFSSSVRNIGLL